MDYLYIDGSTFEGSNSLESIIMEFNNNSIEYIDDLWGIFNDLDNLKTVKLSLENNKIRDITVL